MADMTKKATPRRATIPSTLFAVAACSMSLTTGNELQLTPAGIFRGMDGRPTDAPHWYIDAAVAQRLIAAADARQTSYVIDYDHQTLRAKENGQPAPAAGWFKKLEWREGVGLFAVDVEWTDDAKAMIAADKYRYISPVFGYDKDTGTITVLYMAAITNNPAVDDMDQVLLAVASRHFTPHQSTASLTQEVPSMDELLEQLRWLLNLPVGATAEDILAQLQKLTEAVKQAVPDQAAAASFDLVAHLAKQQQAIASLSAATPDPAQFVAIGVMQELQTQVAALTSQLNTTKLDGLIKQAMEAGKLLPSQEAWAREWGGKDFAALSAYIDVAQPIVALTGMQTGGTPPAGDKPGALTENQVALCRAMGISEEDFRNNLQAGSQA